VGAGFCTSYYWICKIGTTLPWETVRLGIAGSLANMICECAFHIIDTINIRSKIPEGIKVKESTFQ